MAKILLVNPSYKEVIYKNATTKYGIPYDPVLSLPTIATPLLNAGHDCKILDLNLESDFVSAFKSELTNYRPDIIGFTFTTPLFNQAAQLSIIAREINKNIIIFSGGAHTSSMPEEVLVKSEIDIAVLGEGDFIIRDYLNNTDLTGIEGIAYKKDGKIIINPQKKVVTDIDSIPFPAWHLYDITKYKVSKLSTKKNPAGYIETSRGCPWKCCYCNKNIYGKKYRAKSPKRLVDEMEYMLKCGFNEIHIIDDAFSADMRRAKEVCNEIIKRNLKFPWYPLNGIRVDCVDEELLHKMKSAGVYKISYGVESGNDEILKRIDKGITKDHVRKAVQMTKKIGLDTFLFFMIALPGETEQTMQDTLDFAKELSPDIAKFNITIPLPGTKLFEEWKSQGIIKTENWDKYNYYSPSREIYEHPNLSWETIEKFYKRAYREFYFRPGYLINRLIKTIKDGTILDNIKYAISTRW